MNDSPAPVTFPPLRPRDAGSVALGNPSSRSERRETTRLQARMSLRRLRYFIELLGEGYSRALNPNPLSRCLRADRIALGIDVPELDTVPLWASLHQGRIVCIPFIEYILGQIKRCLQSFLEYPPGAPNEGAQALRSSAQMLFRFMENFSPMGDEVPSLPRLKDFYLEKPLVERLCGDGGLLQDVLSQCESLMVSEMEERLESTLSGA